MKLSDALSLYLRARQSSGWDGSSAASVLRHFARCVGVNRELDSIMSREVQDYTDGTGPRTGYCQRKHSALLGFYRFALARGLVSKLPMPVTIPKVSQVFQPYAYSEAEFARLLDALSKQQCATKNFQASTFRVLLLLLYGAGLRLSEAMHLTRADFDIEQRLLIVRETKFYKTRLVPVGPHLFHILDEYQKTYQPMPNPMPGDPLLRYSDGQALNGSCVRRAFARLRVMADVGRGDDARYQPRLHDMRHTFAVARLTAWYKHGEDVQLLLPLLSSYLGHASIAGTQVYLQMTPELLSQAAIRFERYALPQEGCHE
jgi:integrase/recombinase XerD